MRRCGRQDASEPCPFLAQSRPPRAGTKAGSEPGRSRSARAGAATYSCPRDQLLATLPTASSEPRWRSNSSRSMSRTASPLRVRRTSTERRSSFGAFVMDVTALDQLLEIVRDVRAQIVAARAQLARRQFLIAHIEQQQRLHAVDLALVTAVELVLDDVEQLPVQPLDRDRASPDNVCADGCMRPRAPQPPAVSPMLSSSFPRLLRRAHLYI